MVHQLEKNEKINAATARNSFFKDSFLLTLLNFLARSVGLIIPLIVARKYGVSGATDAFFFAYSILIFITGIFSGVAETVIVPFIAERRTKEGKEFKKFFSEVVSSGSYIIVGVTLATLVAVKPLMHLVSYWKLPVRRAL